MQNIESAAYWNSRYQEDNTPWDIGYASPPIARFIDQLEDTNISILIPGAGKAHEALYLHLKGFRNVYVCDWAPEAFDQLRSIAPDFPAEHQLVQDFFELRLSVDLVLEQTFFCALPPGRRTAYVQKMHEILQADGQLAGLLFAHEFEKEGPPFGGDQQLYRRLFEPYFTILQLDMAPNSILPRSGSELFLHARKKNRL